LLALQLNPVARVAGKADDVGGLLRKGLPGHTALGAKERGIVLNLPDIWRNRWEYRYMGFRVGLTGEKPAGTGSSGNVAGGVALTRLTQTVARRAVTGDFSAAMP
jgi:hypothetical protein